MSLITVYLSLVLDSIYRTKYEQARREIELTKKRLNQEHEEELESTKAAKKAIERRVK